MGTSRIQNMEASAGFEPAVEVSQIAICRSQEFAEVRCVLSFSVWRSLWFIACRQSSAALPSPLPSTEWALTQTDRTLRHVP